jgi:hypothetical protein
METKMGAAREQPDAPAIPDCARCKLMIGSGSKTGGILSLQCLNTKRGNEARSGKSCLAV